MYPLVLLIELITQQMIMEENLCQNGAQGPAGAQGHAGAQCLAGVDGVQDHAGAQGTAGADGEAHEYIQEIKPSYLTDAYGNEWKQDDVTNIWKRTVDEYVWDSDPTIPNKYGKLPPTIAKLKKIEEIVSSILENYDLISSPYSSTNEVDGNEFGFKYKIKKNEYGISFEYETNFSDVVYSPGSRELLKKKLSSIFK